MNPPDKSTTPTARLPRWIRVIDATSDGFAVIAKYALLLSCVISGGNAMVRFFLDVSSNGWLEIQWYLFGAGVMLGAAQVLRLNEHVRVDLFYGRWQPRTQGWLDLFGFLLFLLPVMALMTYLSWPIMVEMFVSGEISPNAGGLIRWPAMSLLPLGFALLVLQGLSELGKRVLWLRGRIELTMHYEKPLQ